MEFVQEFRNISRHCIVEESIWGYGVNLNDREKGRFYTMSLDFDDQLYQELSSADLVGEEAKEYAMRRIDEIYRSQPLAPAEV